jgi:hypothetical protein
MTAQVEPWFSALKVTKTSKARTLSSGKGMEVSAKSGPLSTVTKKLPSRPKVWTKNLAWNSRDHST